MIDSITYSTLRIGKMSNIHTVYTSNAYIRTKLVRRSSSNDQFREPS
jgi:hypothetical protein